MHSVIRAIVNFIRDAGATHFVYRTDREPAIGSMIDEAVSMLGRFARKVLSDADTTDHGLQLPRWMMTNQTLLPKIVTSIMHLMPLKTRRQHLLRHLAT